MLPSIWGAKTWRLLHCLTFLLKTDLSDLFYHLQYILPCAKCRHSYREHLDYLPIPKKDFTRWLIQLHNRVNISVGKKEENTEKMYIFWKEQSKYITEKDMLEAMYYMVSSHPGYYKSNNNIIEAHIIIWNVISQVFPKIKQFMNKNPLNTAHKMDYLVWFNKLKKELNIHISKISQTCTTYCSV